MGAFFRDVRYRSRASPLHPMTARCARNPCANGPGERSSDPWRRLAAGAEVDHGASMCALWAAPRRGTPQLRAEERTGWRRLEVVSAGRVVQAPRPTAEDPHPCPPPARGLSRRSSSARWPGLGSCANRGCRRSRRFAAKGKRRFPSPSAAPLTGRGRRPGGAKTDRRPSIAGQEAGHEAHAW